MLVPLMCRVPFNPHLNLGDDIMILNLQVRKLKETS